MQWKDVGNVIGKAAPLIGTLLGGPAGGAVGAMVASALGVKNDKQAVIDALKTDPQALVKIKELEMKHQEELQRLALQKGQLDLQELQAKLQDTQSARQREMENVKNTGKADYNLYFLAWSIVLGFIGLIVLLSFHILPKDTNGVIFMLFGALAAAFGQVIQYFFGSSVGSKEKTHLMVAKTFGKPLEQKETNGG